MAKARLATNEKLLTLLEDVSYLSSLATDAVVTLDDLTEKLEANEDLESRVGVPRAELAAAESTLRKVLNRIHEVKSAVRTEILAGGQGGSASEAAEAPGETELQTLDGLWDDAHAAHQGPWEYESCLLPNADSAKEAQ